MTKPVDRPPSRLVILLVLTGLSLVLAAICYTMIRNRRGSADLVESPAVGSLRSPQMDAIQRLRLLMALLLVTALGIIAFVIGSYLAIKFGRNLIKRDLGGKPTQYVDAWANYRLSPEALEALDNDDLPPHQPGSSDDGSSPGGDKPEGSG